MKTLHLGEEFDLDAEEPYQVLRGLLLREMQELRDDMDEFVELDNKARGVCWCMMLSM